MENSFFLLADYLKRQVPPLHRNKLVGTRVKTPELPSDASEQYTYVIKETYRLHEAINTLSESVQVAQYECLDFPETQLKAFESSECLIDRYVGPIAEVMNSIFLMDGHSPLVITKEILTVDNECFSSFSLVLQNPPQTVVPRYSGDSTLPVEPLPCGVYGMFLPVGSLSRDIDITLLSHEESIVSKAFAVLRAGLAQRGVNVSFGVISDQTTTLVVSTLATKYNPGGYDQPCIGGLVTDAYSPRHILSALSYQILDQQEISRYPKDVPRLRQYFGAQPSQTPAPPSDPRWFSDFDMYTMQRSWDYWVTFLQWRRKIAFEGSQDLPEVGDTLRLGAHGFQKRRMMFSPSSHQKLPLPQDTFDSVHANRRSRDKGIDALLDSHDTLPFAVTKVVRVGRGEWSQVVFGRLAGHDKELCLKVLDERLFPPPEGHQPQFNRDPPCWRLPSLVFSEDLVNREAAVYRRLPELQGSLLPHCYGFHLITLPSGWQAYGVLLEVIDGPTIYNLLDSPLTPEVQKDLFTKIKHGICALGRATISQADWNLNNIMCPLDASGKRNAVFIDFAFAYLHLGDEEGVRSFDDTNTVATNLGWGYPRGFEYIQSVWGPKDDFAF